MDPSDPNLQEALRQWRERIGPEYRQDMAQPEREPWEPEIPEVSGPSPFTPPQMSEPPPEGGPPVQELFAGPGGGLPEDFDEQARAAGRGTPISMTPPAADYQPPPPRPPPPSPGSGFSPRVPVFRPGMLDNPSHRRRWR